MEDEASLSQKRITSFGYESSSIAPNLSTSSETWPQILGQPAGRAVLCVEKIMRYPKRLFLEFSKPKEITISGQGMMLISNNELLRPITINYHFFTSVYKYLFSILVARNNKILEFWPSLKHLVTLNIYTCLYVVLRFLIVYQRAEKISLCEMTSSKNKDICK